MTYVPPAGTLLMDGYEITTTVAPFSITATSTGDMYSAPLNMFIGNDGVLRCSNVLAVPAKEVAIEAGVFICAFNWSIRSIAWPSATPGGRLNEMVTAVICPN